MRSSPRLVTSSWSLICDGQVEFGDVHRRLTEETRGRVIDVAREGLPTKDVIEMPAGCESGDGRFLLTASSRVRRPSREQLLVAVTLAEQVLTARVGRERPRHR
jgi:hypothetical protein